MTEYEIATLSIREWGLWVALGQLAIGLAIGLGQIAIVWYAIHAMQAAGNRRAREHDQKHAQTMDDQRTRHEETMTALRTLIERTRGTPAAT